LNSCRHPAKIREGSWKKDVNMCGSRPEDGLSVSSRLWWFITRSHSSFQPWSNAFTLPTHSQFRFHSHTLLHLM
jgi:hypothetical protein